MDDMGYDYVAFGDFHFKDDLQYSEDVYKRQAYNHGYYMLKGQGNCLAHFWHTIQIKQGCVLFHCIVCIHFLIASFTPVSYTHL